MKKNPVVSRSFIKQRAKQLKKEKGISLHEAYNEAVRPFDYANYKHFLNESESNHRQQAQSKIEALLRKLSSEKEIARKLELAIPFVQNNKMSFPDMFDVFEQFRQSAEAVQTICRNSFFLDHVVNTMMLEYFRQSKGDVQLLPLKEHFVVKNIVVEDLECELLTERLNVRGLYTIEFEFEHFSDLEEDMKHLPHFNRDPMFGQFEMTLDRNKQVTIANPTIGEVTEDGPYMTKFKIPGLTREILNQGVAQMEKEGGMGKSNNSKIEYERRINRVMDYVSKNLSEPLTLETLADVAAFSPFHFHRVFKSMTGENLSEFIQRIRLEAAAGSLVYHPNKDVTEIALDVGFGSSSTFAHAFKTFFGVNATEWRGSEAGKRRDQRRQEFSKMNQSNSNLAKAATSGSVEDGQTASNGAWSETQEETLKVTVKNLPDYHVAYMRNVGPYGPSQIWGKLLKWAGPRGLVNPGMVALGIANDDPNVTAPEKCRYDACIVVPKDFAPDQNVNLSDVPGGQYAIYDFEGTAGDVPKAWDKIFTQWLPSSGYQPDNRLCFERYPADMFTCGKQDLLRWEICVPVKPL